MAHEDHLIKLIDERHAAVMERLGEVLTEQRLTGAIVASHSTRIAVLEDRTPGSPGKQGGIWGALGGLVAGFLAGLIK